MTFCARMTLFIFEVHPSQMGLVLAMMEEMDLFWRVVREETNHLCGAVEGTTAVEA